MFNLLGNAIVDIVKPPKRKMATAKLGDKKELKEILGKNGFKISKNYTLNEKSCFESIGVFAPTRAGKTTSVFIPNLLNENLMYSSLVVSDPKGELYETTANFQRSIGRTPIVFAPLQPEISYTYNLLEECKDLTEIRELAQSLLINGALSMEITTGKSSGGIEWLTYGVPLLTSALLYCKEQGYPMSTIPNAFNLIIERPSEDLDLLLNNSSVKVKQQYDMFKTAQGSSKTISSIKMVLSSALALFTDDKLIKTTKKSEFNAQLLREKPICLYIQYPERKSAYLSPFMASFYYQLITKCMDSNSNLPVLYLMDEAANIGMIPNLPSFVSTTASRFIGFMMCFQSLSQLIGLYGRNNAMSIVNNLKTKIVLPGLSDIESLKYISELCGEAEFDVSSSSQNAVGKATNNSTIHKNLFNNDEIRRLKTDEVLIISKNFNPVIDKANFYFLQNKYTQYTYLETPPSR